MKKIIAFCLLISMLCAGLTGCGSLSSPDEKEIGGDLNTAVVWAQMPSQSAEDALLGSITYYSYETITPEELMKELTDWTGLDFFVSISYDDKGNMFVDWKSDSTLIANLDDREQKEEFFFFDADTMRWFMMDSVWMTLQKNFNTEIYYTMDGGKTLQFEELYPANVFDTGIPYMGSAFYFNHANIEDDAQTENDMAYALIWNAMDFLGHEANGIIKTGEETINGELCGVYSAGTYPDDSEELDVLYTYAVSESWIVYYMDSGSWISGAAG